MNIVSKILLSISGLSLAACATSERAQRTVEVMTKATQEAMTTEAALQRLREGNERFVSGRPLMRDLPAQVQATAAGQYPFATILSCLDSRIPVEYVFDQGIGDVFTARVAGNFVNADILGSMEFASKVAGSKLIVVVSHDKCGAVKGSCDGVQLGHVTSLVEAIQPSVAAVAGPTCNSSDAPLVERIAENNVERTIKQIREQSPLLKELEDQGKLKIVGAMYDLDSGRVVFK